MPVTIRDIRDRILPGACRVLTRATVTGPGA